MKNIDNSQLGGEVCKAMLLVFLLTAAMADFVILIVLPEIPEGSSKAAYFMRLFDPLPMNFSMALAVVAASIAGFGRAIVVIVQRRTEQNEVSDEKSPSRLVLRLKCADERPHREFLRQLIESENRSGRLRRQKRPVSLW